MKKLLLVLTLLLTLCFETFTVYAEAISKYYVRDWRIYALVNPDGSMNVEEYITYEVSNKHEGPVVRHIDIAHSSNMENLEVFVVTRMDPEDIAKSDIEPYEFVDKPGQNMSKVYAIKPGASTDEIQDVLIYFPTDAGKQTVVLKYRLDDLVSLYRDVAVLYWNPVIMGHGHNIDNIEVNIALPKGVDDIKPFVYGALSGKSGVLDDGTVSITGERLEPQEFMEVTLVFPKDIVGQGRKIIDNHILDRVLEVQQSKMQEMELLREKKEQERRWRIAAIAVIVMGVIGVVVCMWVWFTTYRRGRREKKQIKQQHKYINLFMRPFTRFSQFRAINKYRRGEKVIPEKSTEQTETGISKLHSEVLPVNLPADYYTPAELSVLLHGGRITARDMVATLIDLVVRRYLDVEPVEIDNEKCYVLSLKDFDINTLKPHEEYLINWFFRDIGDDGKVSTKDIEQAAYRRGIHAQFNNRFIIWRKLVAKQAARWKFQEKATRFKFYKRTSFGKNHYNEWLKFKKDLQELSRQANSVPLGKWEVFLAYAFTLGIAKHIVKGLKVAFPDGTPLDDNLTILKQQNFFAIDCWFDLTKSFGLIRNRLSRLIRLFTLSIGKFGQNRQRNM